MKRVLVTVSGGIADYVADEGVEVAVFDEDLWDCGYVYTDKEMFDQLRPFDHLMPEWVKDRLNSRGYTEDANGTD